MAETIFTGKNIKEFSFQQSRTFGTAFNAILAWLLKYFFMGDGP